MRNRLLQNNLKSYLLIFACGVLAGVVTRLTDFCKADTLWSFSSVATLFGFWILCVTLIVLFSSSNLCAGVHSFLYMFGMTLSFYGLQYVLGWYLPRYQPAAFQTNLFLLYTFLSAGCGVGAFILRYWERKTKISALLYALPIGALLAETIGTAVCLISRSVFLFQFLLDLIAVLLLGICFFRRTENKGIYLAAVCATAALVYLTVYHPFLHLV